MDWNEDICHTQSWMVPPKYTAKHVLDWKQSQIKWIVKDKPGYIYDNGLNDKRNSCKKHHVIYNHWEIQHLSI